MYRSTVFSTMETDPGNNQSVKVVASDGAQTETKKTKDILSEKEREIAQTVTPVYERWKTSLQMTSHYEKIGHGENLYIDVKAEVMSGKVFVEPDANRCHGNDEKKTGESLMADGAQHPIIVVPKCVAEAAGMQSHRYKTDPHKEDSIPEDAWVTLEGNGRMEFLYGKPVESWPKIYAILPTKNAEGLIIPPRIFNNINTNLKPWNSADRMGSRICYEGGKGHPAWAVINKLKNEGYPFTSACEYVTLKKGSISSKNITNMELDTETLFANYEYAKRIHAAAVKAFGEGADKTLKNKAFSAAILDLFDHLCVLKEFDAESSTAFLEKFFKDIPSGVVMEIVTAKKEGDVPKDIVKVQMLKEYFIKYKATIHKK